MPGICSSILLVVLICFASSSHAANTYINNGAEDDKPIVLRLTSVPPPGVRSVHQDDQHHDYLRSSTGNPNPVNEASYFLDLAVQMGTPPQNLTLQATTIDGCMAEPPLIQIEPSYCSGAPSQCSSFQTAQSSTFQSTSQWPGLSNWNPDVDVDVFTFTDIYGNRYSKKMLFVPVDTWNPPQTTTPQNLPYTCAQNTQACYDPAGNPINCPSDIAGSMPLFAIDQVMDTFSSNPVPIRTNYSKSLTEALCPNGPRSAIITGYSDSYSWSNALLTLCQYSGMQATILSKFQISFPQAKGNQVFYTWTQSTYPLDPIPGQTLGMNSALTGSMFLRYPLFIAFANAIQQVTGEDPTSCNYMHIHTYLPVLSSLQLCGIDFATFPTLTFTFAGPCEYGSEQWCEGTAVVSPSSYLIPVPGFNSNGQKCYTLAIGSTPASGMSSGDIFGLPLYREQNISLMTPPGATTGNSQGNTLSFLPEDVVMFIESRTPLVRIPTYNDTCFQAVDEYNYYPNCTDYIPPVSCCLPAFIPYYCINGEKMVSEIDSDGDGVSYVPLSQAYQYSDKIPSECLNGRSGDGGAAGFASTFTCAPGSSLLASDRSGRQNRDKIAWHYIVGSIGGAAVLVVAVGLAVYLHKRHRRRLAASGAGELETVAC